MMLILLTRSVVFENIWKIKRFLRFRGDSILQLAAWKGSLR